MSALSQWIWLVPAAVGLTSLVKPPVGLACLAGSLVLFGSPPGGPYLEALDVTVLVAILCCLRSPFARSGGGAFKWCAAAVVAVGLGSLVPLAYRPPSWEFSTLLQLASVLPGVESWSALYTWRAAADLVLAGCLFLVAQRTFGESTLRQLGLGLATGLSVVVILGLWEQLGVVDLGVYRAIGTSVLKERMHSLFFNSGWFAEFLVLATPFSVAALVAAGSPSLASALAVSSLSCVLLSQQRGAWMATALQLVLLLALRPPAEVGFARATKRWVLVATLLAGSLGLLIALDSGLRGGLRQRIEASATGFSDLGGRTQLWSAALAMASERPGMGWGLGSFAPAYDRLHPAGTPGGSRIGTTAHSWGLNVLAEQGIVGLLALSSLAGAVAVCLSRLVRRRGQTRVLALGLAISLSGAAAYGLVQHVPFLRSVQWLLWLLLGAVACLDRGQTELVWPRRAALASLLAMIALLPLRMFVPAPRFLGNHAYGLHEEEMSESEPFRWLGPRAAIRLPWESDCLVVELANGHPLASEHPVTVDLRTATWRESVTVRGDWQRLVLPVGRPQAPSLILHLSSDLAFRPFWVSRAEGLPASADVRLLSVAARPFRWQACPASAPSAADAAPSVR